MLLKNFIVFEGIDGAGTSTQIKKLCARNSKLLIPTAEPTDRATGRFLRQLLAGDFKLDERTTSYLFAADRCEHIYGEGGVEELLKAGRIVVSDRYFFSSLAYQSATCGKGIPRHVNAPFPLPEVLFYFEINPEVSLKRVESRDGKREIYEKIDYQKKTAALYDEVINEYENNPDGMKVIRVDATKSIDEIADFIYNTLINLNIIR
ncbi:dTMP kinase [Treponema sp. C6A8]|uniref:dTMP kinase n=1 Tax=Treponema sp. C6A8 TaxID=1410609 RepID=UPI00048A0D07|nr:dTMP kinase [Treponema sp. C6A8]